MPRRQSPDTTIGERIRTRRQLRGWSVRHAASRAGISHATWSRIENGRQAADNRFVVADIAAALECAPADLTGTPMPAADRETMAAQASVYAIRQALVDVDLAEPATPRARPLPELERDAALVRELWGRCDYAGAGRLLPPLLREIHSATGGPDRLRALRLLCDAAYLAAATVRPLGYPAEAWLAAERCRDAAEATEDPVLLGLAAFARAQAAAACGSYGRGLVVGDRAVDDLQAHADAHGGMEMLGMLHLTGAYSARGLKRTDDSEARLAEAAAIAERTGETTTLGLWFGPTNVNLWRISLETDAGEPGRAVEVAKGTNPAAIDANVRQVAFYADTARALARVRRDREAVRYLLTAERLAPQHVHSSAMVQETARALLERSQRQAGGSELRGLCDRMGLSA